MGEGPNGWKTHKRRTENKNSRKAIIAMSQLPFNYKKLNEAAFCFFFNETLET